MTKTEQAENLANLVGSGIGEMFILSFFLLYGIYIFLRIKKKNMMWVADIYLTLTFIFFFNYMLFPHKYVHFFPFLIDLIN